MVKINVTKNKAVFLDRDGVINEHRTDYVKTPDEFVLLPEVPKWLKLLKKFNFKLIIITNQSMIDRGISDINNLKLIHKKMQDLLKKHDVQIDKIYFCPHLPKTNCFCRKPKPGLIKKAIDEMSIDITKSWLIGDNETDIIAGKKIGCKTIKINTNSNLGVAVSQILP